MAPASCSDAGSRTAEAGAGAVSGSLTIRERLAMPAEAHRKMAEPDIGRQSQ